MAVEQEEPQEEEERREQLLVLAVRPAADSAAVGGGEDQHWHSRRSCGPSSCRDHRQRRPREAGRNQDGPEFHQKHQQRRMEYRRPPWPASASATRRAWPSDPSWPGRHCRRGWHCAGRWRRGDHRFRRRPFCSCFRIDLSTAEYSRCPNQINRDFIFRRSFFRSRGGTWRMSCQQIRTRKCRSNLLCSAIIVSPACTAKKQGLVFLPILAGAGEQVGGVMKVIFWHSAIAQADFDFLITVQNSCSGFCTFGNQHQLAALRRMLAAAAAAAAARGGDFWWVYMYVPVHVPKMPFAFAFGDRPPNFY